MNEYRFIYNAEYDIYLDSPALEKWTLSLVTIKCPICDPYVKFSSVDEKQYMKNSFIEYSCVDSLNIHMRESHGRCLCPVCVESKSMFIHEYPILSQSVAVHGATKLLRCIGRISTGLYRMTSSLSTLFVPPVERSKMIRRHY